MEREAVREYIEHAQSIIESSPQMDEANTKAAVLRDFLELLGWEIPTNTQLEYSVKAFGKTYKVDYALVIDGAPVGFIEAKGVDTPLTDKHREQLAAYLKNEDVNLGILTNGKEYEFYRRQVIDSKVNVNTLTKASLHDLPDRVTILSAFTKDAIQNDEWVNILNRIEDIRSARDKLKQNKGRYAARITENLTDWVADVVSSQAESQAKEMIDRLIEDLEREIDSDSSALPSDVAPKESDSRGNYIIKIQDGEETLATMGDDNQSDAMAEAVGYLIENHDLISKIESLPYVPGEKNAILNDQPIHPDGEREMRTYRELEGGYYLFTSLNQDSKKRQVHRFAKKCGLDSEFEGEW